MKKIKNVIFVLTFIIVLLFLPKVYAKNYSIEKINMDVTLEQNGNLTIKEELTYNFSGDYNGIYITIPYGINDKKYDSIRKQTSLLNDSFYNASNVYVVNINSNSNDFKNTRLASNGDTGVYTINDSNNIKTIKIYSPSYNEVKKFNITYVLQNVAVRHNDIGELYYNFIGGKWDADIKNLNIDIHLPNNNDREALRAFGHGARNGKVTIIDEKNINLSISDVKAGDYVAGRVLFNLSNIQDSTKCSSKNALSSILQEEEKIFNKTEQERKLDSRILMISVLLLIYWYILILKYEKDKKYGSSSNEDEMFKKYNPLMAGCIQGSRNVLSRDIIAVILELVNKKYLKMEIRNNIDCYEYYLSYNEKSNYEPDEIEKYVLDWFFNGGQVISLINRLNLLPIEEGAIEKFNQLDNKATEKLNKIGANKKSVPLAIRAFNVFLFIAAIVLSIVKITTIWKISSHVLSIILLMGITMLPFIIYLAVLPVLIINKIKKITNKLLQKVTGQKIAITSITIILTSTLAILITALACKNYDLLVYEFLTCVATLIMFTDNLMLKNDPIMIEDYSRLNSLKKKIEKYSMMSEKEIKEIVLWEKYLTYSIAFGISNKIINKISPIVEEYDILKLLQDSNVNSYLSDNYDYFYKCIGNDQLRKVKGVADKVSDVYGKFSGGSSDSGFSGGGDFSGGGGARRRRRRILSLGNF